MSDRLRCQCGSVDFTDEDPSLPYETPRALHWMDRSCEAKPQPPTDKQTIARLQAELAEAREVAETWKKGCHDRRIERDENLARAEAAESRGREMREALANVLAGFRAGYREGTKAKAALLRLGERALSGTDATTKGASNE